MQSDEAARDFLEAMNTAIPFVPGVWMQIAIAERTTDALIGDVGLCVAADGGHAEVGFTLDPAWQGRGLATEALRETLVLLFDATSIHDVRCVTDARNDASIRLIERVGMQRIASNDAMFRGASCVEHTYAIERPARVADRP